MALETTLIPIAIAGGLAQQVDDLADKNGAWLTIDNLYYDKAGVLRKRPGYAALSNDFVSGWGGDLSSVRSLHNYEGRLVVVATLEEPKFYSRVAGAWSPHDYAQAVSVQRSSIQRSTYHSADCPHVAVTPAYVVYSWVGDGSLFLKVIDRSTGAIVRNEAALYSDIGAHCTVVCGDYVMVFYDDTAGTSLYARRYTPSTGDMSSALTCNTAEVYVFDANVYSSTKCLLAQVYEDGADSILSINEVNATSPPTFGDGALVYSGVTYVHQVGSISVAQDGTSAFVAFFTFDVTYGVWMYRFDLATFTLQATPSPVLPIVTCGEASLCRVTIGTSPSDTLGGYLMWCGEPNGLNGIRITEIYSFGNTGTLSTAKSAHWTRPYSRPWKAGDNWYAVVSDGELYRGYAVLRLNGGTADTPATPQYVGAIALDEAPGIASDDSASRRWPLPSALSLSEYGPGLLTGYVLPLTVPTVGLGLGADLRGIDEAQFDFSSRQSVLGVAAEAQNCLVMGGAFTGSFDGQTYAELGWHRPPFFVGSANVVAASGGIEGSDSPAYAYLYCAVYEWLDQRGNWHRSEPSAPLEVGISAANDNATVNIDVALTCLTAKGDGTNLERRFGRVAIYRTLKNAPEVFYRLDDPGESTYTNDRGGDYLDVQDDLSDADVLALGYGTLYTQGGVLENTLCPPARAVASWKNRLWVASGDDPRAVWFSKQFVRTEAPGFNPILQIRLDDSPEPVTALAPLGGSLLIFTESRTYALSGEPPNDTGAGNQLIGPELVSDAVGCTDPRSMVAFPGGVIFLGPGGFYVAESAQAPPKFIGGPVEAITDQRQACYGGSHDPARSWIFFVVDSVDGGAGKIVIYDYGHNAWMTWTQADANYAPYGTALVGGVHYWASTVAVMQEDSTSGTDVGDYFPWTLKTPWLRLGTMAGYQRVRRVMISLDRRDGDDVSLLATELRVKLYVDDIDEIHAQFHDFTVLDLEPTNRDRAVAELHVDPQKCRSLQIELIEQQGEVPEEEEGEPGEGGVAIYGLEIEAGTKRGRFKAAGENRS